MQLWLSLIKAPGCDRVEDGGADTEVPAELPTVTREEQLALADQDFFLDSSPALFPTNDILHIRYVDTPNKK